MWKNSKEVNVSPVFVKTAEKGIINKIHGVCTSYLEKVQVNKLVSIFILPDKT